MFRLSVISDEVSQDLRAVAKFARKHGLSGIEIRSAWGLSFFELVDKVDEVKNVVREFGLEVPVLASPFFKASLGDEKEYRKHLELLRKAINMARELECGIIRGFAFWRKGSLKDHEEEVLRRFDEPLDIIRENQIVLAIENEPSTFITNGKILAWLINKLKCEYVRAVWDPGNELMDPEREDPFKGYVLIKDKIIHVHLKDGVRRNDEVEFKPIGEGEVGIEDQLKMLISDNYNEYVSLETHWRPIELSKEAFDLFGQKFSEKGEYASTICMQNLQRIILEVRKKLAENQG
jgi:sugar phosphate isomerase/epimerase